MQAASASFAPSRPLLLATLHAMHAQGYAYAVIGAAGPIEFYRRFVSGTVIPGSWPGLYRGMLGWPAASDRS
jgi:hypothetical protein